MSEWNLSVRLTGQGSNLARKLRDVAADARNASNEVNALRRNLALLRTEAANDIRIRLDVDGADLRSDVSAALTTAGSGQGLSVRLDVDAAHLRDDVTAALATAGSGQGLSVRLDLDAAHLTDEVNTALTTAGAGQDLRVRLDLDAAHLRDDVTTAVTTAGAGQGIRVRLDIDADHLRDDVSAALTSAGAGQGLAVNLRLGNAMQLRREVEAAVRWAAWGHRIEIPIGLADRMSLRREVSDAVRWASMNQTIRVRVEPDTSALRGLGGTIGGGGSGGGGAGFGLAGLLPIATAAIPLVAGLSTALPALASGFGIAGGAATAFGIALAGQIGPLSDLADAETKYQEAVRDHGAASLEAAEAQLAYQRQLAALPPETQQAAAALTRLKGTFGDWSDEMAGFTMEPVTKSFAILEELLPHLSPAVESFSGQLDRLMDVAGGAVASPAFAKMAEDVAALTDAQLDAFTDQVIHLLRIVSQGDADAGVIGQIVAYMRENGPAARAALDAIGDAVGNLIEAGSAAGPVMLQLVTAAARLVAALPPEVVGVILQAAAALKLLQLAGAGAAAVAAGYGRVRTALLGLAAASTAAGGGLAGLRAAFLALGTAAKASVILAGIGALVYAVSQLSDIGEEAPPNVDKLTISLGKLGATGKVTGEAAAAFGKDFGKLRDQIDKVLDPSVTDRINNWGADITDGLLDASDSTEEFNKSMDSIDESLTNLVRGGKADLAAAALENMLKGMSPEQAAKFKSELDGYNSALEDLRFEQELASQSMGVFAGAARDVEAKLNAQKTAADGLRASILALNETNRSAYDAQIQYEQAVDDLTASFKENGNTLNLNTEAGRKNGEAMSAAAKSRDEMIAAGLAAGESMESMTAKSDKLRESMLELATKAFDGNRAKALEYVNTLLGTPEDIKTIVTLERQEAIRGLFEVQDAIDATPDAHTVTVDTLNATAIAALEAVGLKTRQLPDGRTEVFTANGQSLGAIGAVSDALTRLDGKTARTYTTHTTTYYENHIVNNATGEARSRKKLRPGHMADGGVVDYYAEGGFSPRPGSENHVAQIAPAGAYRVWAERETGGESYIPLSPSKRPRSRAIAEETVRRLGGDPAGIQWHADGSVTGWRYDPVSGSLYSPSEAGSAGNKTRKVKVKGKGGKTTTKEVDYFDLGAVEKKLKSTAKATKAWNADLEKVADRVGGDVAEALASMGKEGEALARKMARGSTKYINEMAAALRGLQQTAKASLTDYTRQLSTANKVNKAFADNLAKLSAQGYGDLAAQLASQNDEAAQQLAAAAVKDKGKASKANTAAKAANSALTSDQVQDLVQIIAAIRTKDTGIHDVASATGLGEDVIIAIANKAKGQISSSLGTRATRFLSDLTKANKHMAYADGGIRAGLYATRGGIIRFAEPETHGEAYLPLSPSKRRTALPVLHDVATRFGLGLTDARATRPVVIVRESSPTNVTVTAVRTGASASEIGAQVGRSVRRARRGGVASRAA